jgi:hypothetical protein
MAGALEGLTVIEFAGIGPGPFACMMLADHGARVIRIERPGVAGKVGDGGNRDILNRNRERLVLDMKDPGRWPGSAISFAMPTLWSKAFALASWSGWGWGLRFCSRTIRALSMAA